MSPELWMPKRVSLPTTSVWARSPSTNTLRTNSSGVCSANSRVNSMTSTASRPVPSSSSSRCSRPVSRAGARSGCSTATGWGSKVTATEASPSSRARETTVPSTARWPRWTPSKLPRVATLGPKPAGMSSSEVQRCTAATLVGGEHDPAARPGARLVEEGHQASLRVQRGDRLLAARPRRGDPLAEADRAGLVGGEPAHREGPGRRVRQGDEVGPGALVDEALQRHRRVQGEVADPGTAQRGEVSPDAQRGAEVAGQGPDVGAGAHLDLDVHVGGAG